MKLAETQEGRERRPHSSHINYHAPTRSLLFRINVGRTVFQLQEPLQMEGDGVGQDRRTQAGRNILGGQRWTETTGAKLTPSDCLWCLMGAS